MIEFQAEFPYQDFPRLTHFGFESGAPTSYPPRHRHFGYEFFYFSEGSGNVRLSEKTKPVSVKAHDLIVIAPGAEHSFITQAHHLSYYWLGFQTGKRVRRGGRSTLLGRDILPGELTPPTGFASAVDQHLAELDKNFESRKSGESFVRLSVSPRFGLIFSDIREELSNREVHAREIIYHRVLELLTRVSRSLRAGSGENAHLGLIDQVKRFLSERHAAPPPLKTLASVFKRHPAYLSRLFAEQTGQTLTAFVNERRMISAREMLLRGSRVGEVARALGFASLDYFSARFKKWSGKAPSALPFSKKRSRRSR